MNPHDVHPATDLADRYGGAGKRRRIAIGMAVAVAAAFLGWLVWATWFHATPQVTSRVTMYDVVDAHTATAVIQVDRDADAEDVNCRVQALATDHSVVGVFDFDPVDGRNEVTITTEREATTVEKVGCTAKGQPRPR